MKKEQLQKIFIMLVVLVSLLQLIYNESIIKLGEYKMLVRNIEYFVIAVVAVVSVLYARLDNKKTAGNLIKLYLLLIVLFILFKIRGII
ncbi:MULTISPECIES: hypothetical protein [Peptoniphilus]|uniref:hypothetical protein n=1 Tax=Peptoniphilus TaxID=162289 RepID=UPI0001DAA0D4|nr:MULTISPECIES: hypothetical protein [Peptoniphilus]EFI41659.1 hypothetical protein HMPREF0629_00282 [Peptoniphilus sp. oral taxon 386 str. F0131]